MEAPAHTVVVESARTRFAEGSIEHAMLVALARHLGTGLAPAAITVRGDVRFEAEATDEAHAVFVQFVANTGEFKSAHRNRVTANLFKLAWIRHALFPHARHVLCVTPNVTQALAPTGWAALATRDLGIDVLIYEADSDEITPFLDPRAASA